MPAAPAQNRPPQAPPQPPEPPPAGLSTPQGTSAAAAAASTAPALAVVGAGAYLGRATDETVDAAVSALRRFWTKVRLRNEEWLRKTFEGNAPSGDIAQAVDDESAREYEFQTKAQVRFKDRMAKALGNPDPKKRAQAVKTAIANERRYAVMRQEEMARRNVAAVDRAALRRASPQGAFWKLDPTKKTHTAECVAMAGKVWPWQALDRWRFWPPLGGGCGCSLYAYKVAVAQGWVRPGRVPNVEDAIRAVGRLTNLHEGDDLELSRTRYALAEAGVMTRETFDEQIKRLVERELWPES